MTQEDDDLEEELRRLDIREDHGAEDSDVTPTNTPPTSPHILYIKKYPPIKPVSYEENKDFGRFSRGDDNDCRSDSSLSWGDDEFEGEATRQVSILFDQLDSLLYPEERTSAVPKTEETRLEGYLFERRNSKDEAKGKKEYLPVSNNILPEGEAILPQINRKHMGQIDSTSISPEMLYNSARLLESSSEIGSDSFVAPKPSSELIEECSNWMQHFPHFRVQGRCIETSILTALEQHLSENEEVVDQEEFGSEELLDQDGDFSDLLPLVSFTSAKQVKNSTKANPKTGTSNSRVCSGSSDPEVLKEQVLIMLFDKLWPTITEKIEPLLNLYAKYVIEQSVQYSSLSREPSTRGARMGQQIPVRKWSDELGRPNSRYLTPLETPRRPDSGSNRCFRAIRPLSGIQRPSSAANRLQGISGIPSVQQTELHDLLHVTQKPLQNGEDRLRSRTPSASHTRESSARSNLSSVSLPSVTTPRRPVSSRTTAHLLTPMKVDSFNVPTDLRPASTSSYGSRSRFQEKFQYLSRQGTIQEFGSSISAQELDEDEVPESPNPTWSRHISFLPPIGDTVSSTLPKMVNGGPLPVKQKLTSRRSSSVERTNFTPGQDTQLPQSLVKTEDAHHSPLTVRGTTLSATHRPHTHSRPKKRSWGTPIANNNSTRKLIHPEWR